MVALSISRSSDKIHAGLFADPFWRTQEENIQASGLKGAARLKGGKKSKSPSRWNSQREHSCLSHTSHRSDRITMSCRKYGWPGVIVGHSCPGTHECVGRIEEIELAATSLAETKRHCVRDVIIRNLNSIAVSRFAAVAGVAYQCASGTFSLWCKPQKCFPCEHTLW